MPPRYRSTYFAHVFAGGYDAGYYSYIWSEVLDADTVEWFREHGGLRREQRRAVPPRLLVRGGAVDPMEAFAAVRGRAPAHRAAAGAPGPDPRPTPHRTRVAPPSTETAVPDRYDAAGEVTNAVTLPNSSGVP